MKLIGSRFKQSEEKQEKNSCDFIETLVSQDSVVATEEPQQEVEQKSDLKPDYSTVFVTYDYIGKHDPVKQLDEDIGLEKVDRILKSLDNYSIRNEFEEREFTIEYGKYEGGKKYETNRE